MTDTLPILHPQELAMLEKLAGHPLTNDEAQVILREKTIWDAWEDWLKREKDDPR